MLRWVILVVAVVFLTGAATLVVQYPAGFRGAAEGRRRRAEITGPQPKFEIEGDLAYDFGKMARHDQGSHSWVVKNTGEAPLEIWLEGSTTCSCTVSKPGKDENGKPEKLVIQPGKSDTIELNWHTNKDLPEDYSQGGTFGTNDPREAEFHADGQGQGLSGGRRLPARDDPVPADLQRGAAFGEDRGLLQGAARPEADEASRARSPT